ncbi:MAG: T9SS type A sorting domain-containing protein, partial [Paramuribaculum sp.]|nr:T9SS type A sorting domain-containing protein [Paramuribaculum sp.]
IINEKDGRYINEKGNFTANDDTNPYEDEWHTYSLYRFNDGFAIQNGGSAGDKFWTVTRNRIEPGSNNKLGYDKLVFNLVSYSGTTNHHQVESGKSYYILDDNGRYLTNTRPNGSGGSPVFEKITDPDKKSLWVIALDDASGRYSIRSAADNRYVNEKGVFGVNPYYSDWNTYELYGCGNTYAIRNGGSAGTNFWTISGNSPATGGDNINGSYLFKLIDPTLSSVETAEADNMSLRWSIEGGMLSVNGVEDITTLKLTASDGRVVAAASGASVNVSSLTPGIYVLSVTTPAKTAALKITLN